MKVIKIGGRTCPECKIMKPRWAEIEKERPELKTEFYVVEDNPKVVKRYNVTTLPVFIFLDEQGNELSRLTKIQSKERLIEEINKWKYIDGAKDG